jgi:hypothetical protein
MQYYDQLKVEKHMGNVLWYSVFKENHLFTHQFRYRDREYKSAFYEYNDHGKKFTSGVPWIFCPYKMQKNAFLIICKHVIFSSSVFVLSFLKLFFTYCRQVRLPPSEMF